MQKFREGVQGLVATLEKAGATLGIDIAPPSVGRRTRDYERWLRRKIETEVDGRIPAIPFTSHELLVRKAVTKTHPFKADGSGYRDALIWATVLEEASTTQVAFVTNNPKDFGSGGELFQRLADEVSALGFGQDRVRYFESLDAFLQWVGPPSDAIKQALNEGVMQSREWRDEFFQDTAPEVVGLRVNPLAGENGSRIRDAEGVVARVASMTGLEDIVLGDALIITDRYAWAKFLVTATGDVTTDAGDVVHAVRLHYFVDVVYDRSNGTLGAHEVYDHVTA